MKNKLYIFPRIKARLKLYLPLIKSLQTGLLLVTGVTGFVSARCPVTSWKMIIGLVGSMFLTVSGSTILNMVYDRDIDSQMKRTAHRPLPSGKISVHEALILGLFVSALGIAWAFSLSLIYGVIIFAGLFFDVVIYTIWLKRRTPWAILWGGISGGMPILAGRALGVNQLDGIGILFALSILFWIPTHILTFSMRYYEDYQQAGIPTFPSRYGFQNTRLIIALSTVSAAIAIGLGLIALELSWGYLRLLAILTIGLVGLAFLSVSRPSEKLNFGLFKYASLFMLGSMVMMTLGTL